MAENSFSKSYRGSYFIERKHVESMCDVAKNITGENPKITVVFSESYKIVDSSIDVIWSHHYFDAYYPVSIQIASASFNNGSKSVFFSNVTSEYGIPSFFISLDSENSIDESLARMQIVRKSCQTSFSWFFEHFRNLVQAMIWICLFVLISILLLMLSYTEGLQVDNGTITVNIVTAIMTFLLMKILDITIKITVPQFNIDVGLSRKDFDRKNKLRSNSIKISAGAIVGAIVGRLFDLW